MNNQEREWQVPSFVNDPYLRSKQEQQRAYENQREKQRKDRLKEMKIQKRKQELTRKAVKTVFIASATFMIGVLAVQGHKQFVGGERIANELYGYSKDYGIDPGSFAVIDGTVISVDSAISDIINDARYGGMTDAEIKVGFDKLNIAVDKYFEDVSIRDEMNAKSNAYEEYLLERSENKSGGMSR